MCADVTVTLGVDASGVKPGLDQVTPAFQGWVGNTNAVTNATQKLEHQLKSFASEQRMQGRMAKFYANEILEIVPAADGAKKALQGLIGLGIEGVAGGIGFGFALEAVKLVALGLEHVGATAREAFEKADKEVSKVLDEWLKKAEAMKRALAVAIGGEGAGIRFDLAASLKKVNEEIEKARGSLDSLMFPGQRADEQRKLDELLEKRRKIITSAAETYATEKAVTAEKEVQAATLKAVNDAERERLRIVQEVAKAEQTIRDRYSEQWQKGELPDMSFDQKKVDELAYFKEQKTGAEATQKMNEFFAAGWQKGEFPGLGEDLDKVGEKAMSLAEVGNVVEDAFTNAGKAIGGIGGAMAGQIGSVVALTLKFIGLAIAAAEAGVAGIPVVGWIQAIAAGASVAASIAGLIAGAGARADGGPVSAGVPYLVGERGPELMIPGQSGTIVSNEALRGGGINVHFHGVVDAASYWRANERHMVKVLSDAARAGRF